MRRLLCFILAALLTTAGSVVAQSNPLGGPRDGRAYSDPALYAQLKAQWLARVEALPQDVEVLGAAAGFFMILDRPLAEELLERARALEPDNPAWVSKLAHLHRMNAAVQGDVAEALLALNEAERAYAMAPADKRTLPADLPETAFDAGDLSKAGVYAQRLLDEARGYRANWNYGNAIHKGNLVLGRIAVHEGRIADAVTFLRASGETPGSPQLNSFGPNMSLARDLLQQGETEAVLAYFELCRVFWKMGGSRLDAWTKEVLAGNAPAFGANLRY
jgi:tetratricopeptide (TPR) repeat protein